MYPIQVVEILDGDKVLWAEAEHAHASKTAARKLLRQHGGDRAVVSQFTYAGTWGDIALQRKYTVKP